MSAAMRGERWGRKRCGVSEDVAIAQIVRGNRKTLMEMRKERLSGGRPQVIVEMGLLNLPYGELVVRNVSGGAARDITFEFSGSIEDSSGFVISELRYLKEGKPFLGPGEKIRCLWNLFDRLILYLEEKGLHEGLAVKVSYKDLPGEAYATEWRINPCCTRGCATRPANFPSRSPRMQEATGLAVRRRKFGMMMSIGTPEGYASW